MMSFVDESNESKMLCSEMIDDSMSIVGTVSGGVKGCGRAEARLLMCRSSGQRGG